MLEDTKTRLCEWGTWVRSGGQSLGYSAVKLIASGGGAVVADDDALVIDRAVASLKQREPQMGKALVNYYVRGWDFSMVGLEIGVSREKARVILRSAEAWVAGRLFE